MGLERIADVRRDTLATEITRRLLEYLLAGDVQIGDRLPSERRLAEVLGVGRTIVREALKSLTLLGIVEVRQGDGTYVKSAESELLPQAISWGLMLGARRTRDLVEARQYLEVIVAGLAAERRTDDDLRELRLCLEEMTAAQDAGTFVAADVAFHLAMARASDNDAFTQIMSSIRSLLHVWVSRVVDAAADYRPMASDHVVILDAVERGDAEAARQAMQAHMAHAAWRLKATLPEPDEADSPARPRVRDSTRGTAGLAARR